MVRQIKFSLNSKEARDLLGDDYVNQIVIVNFLNAELDRLVEILQRNRRWYQLGKYNRVAKKHDYLFVVWQNEQYKLEQIQDAFGASLNTESE